MTRSGIHGGFATSAQRDPDASALIWRQDTTCYARLRELAAYRRRALEGLDLSPGEPVAIMAEKSPDAIALVLAALELGRPLLLPSPTLAAPALSQVLRRSGCRYLFSPGEEVPIATGTPGKVPAGTAFMLTTSGSTGLPKVVPLSHGAVDRFTTWASEMFGIGAGSVVLNYAPLNFDLCLLDVWATLRFGGTVALVDPAQSTRGGHLADLIVESGVTVVQSVPMFYRLLVDADPEPMAHVQHVVVTGDAIPAGTLAELPRLFPGARIYNVYGCTETNDSFVHEVGPGDVAPLPLGRPIAGVDALIVGDDGAAVTGPGSGELHVATPFQTAGYLDESLTSTRFVTRGGRHWFRSGDLVRRTQDGRVVLQGRNDFQVKIRGVAVNTAETERVLLDHPQVAEAAVVALDDPVGGKKLHAAIRPRGDDRLTSLALRMHTAKHLVVAAVPSTFQIADEPLPRTSTGKVDRRSIESSFAEANNQGDQACPTPTPSSPS